MPKVSNFRVQIDGKHQTLDIHYSKKELFHLKNFPDEIKNLSGFPHDGYRVDTMHETEKSLTDTVFQAVRNYHEAKKNQKKVIAYSITATTEILMNKVGPGRYSGYKESIPQDVGRIEGINNGWGFIINYNVLLEVSNNGVNYYTIDEQGKPRGKSYIGNDKKIIDWTEQREETLKQNCTSLEKLVEKVSAVLLDEKKALQIFDNGTKLIG